MERNIQKNVKFFKKMKWVLIHHLLNRRGGRMPCEGIRDYNDVSTSQETPGATRN